MSPPIPYECIEAVNHASVQGLLGGLALTLFSLGILGLFLKLRERKNE